MKKSGRWNAELITSICAIFISLLTLVVFMYQTNIIRKEQRLSVLPYLTTSNQNFGSPTYKILVKNDGIGPAMIVATKVHYNGETYDTDLPRFLYAHIPDMDTIENILHSNITPGQLIPPGQAIAVLEVNNSLSSSHQLIKALKKYNITTEIVYESVYGDRWILDSNRGFPKKVD